MHYQIEILLQKSDSWRLIKECTFDTKEDAEKHIAHWERFIICNKFRVVPCKTGDINDSIYMYR